MLKTYEKLSKITSLALEKAFPDAYALSIKIKSPLDPQLVIASKKEFGDFQINCALSLAKIIKKSPKLIAEEILKNLKSDVEFTNICEIPEIAGPGFINLKVKKEYLIALLKKRIKDKRLGIEKVTNQKTIIVDFSSPNIAKEMHVGHLRSTIIGDTISRIHEFRGHKVLRLNHVGDWGTQFGMLITQLKEKAPEALRNDDACEIGDLVNFYKEAKKRFDNDMQFKIFSREEVIKLQEGNKNSKKAWSILCKQSRKEFEKIYKRLNIEITERGESFYNKYLSKVVKELEDLNLLVVDNGAKCFFLEGVTGKEGKPFPVIVEKSDGGFNYATTDLAALKYRFMKPPKGDGANKLIYVTDAGQSNHFSGIFEIAERANWIPRDGAVKHVPFGLVQGEDGKKLKTRSGETVKLKDLLDEAVYKAESNLRARLEEEQRTESEEFIKTVSEAVGIGSVKYADLSQNRVTNYQFNYKKMLSLQGNTAPYLLYARVRIAGIARKGILKSNNSNSLYFNHEIEWQLIKEILKFDLVIYDIEKDLLPNRLCNYLFELSQIFNRFYDKLPVIKANEPERSSRLELCNITADILSLGMNLLGIKILERM